MSESVILCEGPHDRSFWDGWLKSIGCTSLRPPPGKKVYDPFSEEVKGGQFAYHSKSGAFVRVIPCFGRDKILPIARNRLKQRVTERLVRLVINIDPDTNADGTSAGATGLRNQDVLAQIQQAEIDSTAKLNADGDIEVDGGATIVSLVRWEASDTVTSGLPNQQTLERLVCAALVAAYPERGPCVQSWLDTRHEPPKANVKEYSWSYMAGWHAGNGCDYFYSGLWNDPKIVSELRTRLEASGAWRIAEALAN